MATVATVDDRSFASEVLNSDAPVLLDVSTAWCGPCKALEPIVASVAKEYAGRLKVVALDADLAPETAAKLSVRGFPTVLVFKNGKEVARQLGAVPRARLVALFNEHL